MTDLNALPRSFKIVGSRIRKTFLQLIGREMSFTMPRTIRLIVVFLKRWCCTSVQNPFSRNIRRVFSLQRLTKQPGLNIVPTLERGIIRRSCSLKFSMVMKPICILWCSHHFLDYYTYLWNTSSEKMLTSSQSIINMATGLETMDSDLWCSSDAIGTMKKTMMR